MRSVIGACETAGQTVYLVQNDTSVVAVESQPVLPLPSVLAHRDSIVGNGKTEGEGVFDFRYGPFTGGYPEAGLIHYYTYGEKVLSVEIDLRLKHRGIENSLRGMTVDEASLAVGRLCGNFTVAHSLAFARAAEALAGYRVDRRTERMRLVALELERTYNHLYVIMRLASAAAQKVLHAHLSALFEESLRITRVLSGRRGMRGFVVPFGTSEGERIPEVVTRTERVSNEFDDLYRKSLSSRNYLDRLHRTAIVQSGTVCERGLTGPSLRASGVGRDLRRGESLYEGFSPTVRTEGDSLARMEVRADEILDSCKHICRLLESHKNVSDRPTTRPSDGIVNSPASGSAVGVAESPTGTVAWYLVLDRGSIVDAYVSSPSVFGFQAYADAIVGNIFTDVPFALESFGVNFADAGR